ncbi:histidinol-phosphate transaminase [Anaeromicrobium sediminis]|nr:histidinol-phosphate transaminase [Anaeromicrobium sediminis]
MSKFRKELLTLGCYVPGKPIEEVKKEYGLDKIIKLASNENPLGPSKLAVEAIKNEAENVFVYPDAASMDLRADIAKDLGIEADNIILGNGGEDVIRIIAQTFVEKDDEVIMATPSFILYKNWSMHMGGVAVEIPLKDYKHDFEKFIASINDKTKAIFVCNPNNPLGNIMTKEEVKYLVDNIPKDLILVLDEAYYDYAIMNEDYPDSLSILKERPNTVIIRTFSKSSGIAGLRVGYAISSEEIISEMTKSKTVFNVNKIAQAAARAALQDKEHIENTVKLNYESLKMITDYCNENNLEYVESNANFIFMNVGKDSRVVFEELLKKGIIIRPGFLWKYDDWLRVSTGTLEQTKEFIDALDSIL